MIHHCDLIINSRYPHATPRVGDDSDSNGLLDARQEEFADASAGPEEYVHHRTMDVIVYCNLNK